MTCELITCLPGVVYRLRYDQEKFNFVYVSEGIAQLCGVTQKRAIEDAESILSLIHSEDYERVIKESLLSAGNDQIWLCQRHQTGRHRIPRPTSRRKLALAHLQRLADL